MVLIQHSTVMTLAYDTRTVCAVDTDGGGMIPSELERKLRQWDRGNRRDIPKPRVLYVIPNGANPSGASLVSDVPSYTFCHHARKGFAQILHDALN